MTAQALRIAVAGATGRMGRMLIAATQADTACCLHSALARADSPGLGSDAGTGSGAHTGVNVDADLHRGLQGAQVLIDFTRPEATLAHLAVCRELGVKMVIGTTGFSAEQQATIAAAAQDIAIVMAPNMSVGVNVVLRLLEQAARALRHGYDIEIVEAHHRHKVDAPSGTALRMGEVIAAAQGRSLEDCAVYARAGFTGERRADSIGFATVRGGDIVGDHLVMFAGTGERIEISHKASSRDGYARGSLLAAHFLRYKPAGLFGMNDVLGLA